MRGNRVRFCFEVRVGRVHRCGFCGIGCCFGRWGKGTGQVVRRAR